VRLHADCSGEPDCTYRRTPLVMIYIGRTLVMKKKIPIRTNTRCDTSLQIVVPLSIAVVINQNPKTAGLQNLPNIYGRVISTVHNLSESPYLLKNPPLHKQDVPTYRHPFLSPLSASLRHLSKGSQPRGPSAEDASYIQRQKLPDA
jgi:hypothetical protein